MFDRIRDTSRLIQSAKLNHGELSFEIILIGGLDKPRMASKNETEA